jgi:hypothetical protein
LSAPPQVQRLREVLAMHATDVYTLESRKVALKLSMDERWHEIEVHRDSLRAELKLVRDDVHRCGGRRRGMLMG